MGDASENLNGQPQDIGNTGNTHQPWYRRYLGLSGREALTGAAVTTGAAVGAPAAATGVLGALGLSSAGVVGGSVAAGVQAGIGNVAAGSVFAGLQSVAATGGFAVLGPVGIGAAAVTGGGFYAWRRWWGNNTSGVSNGVGGSDIVSHPDPVPEGFINQNEIAGAQGLGEDNESVIVRI